MSFYTLDQYLENGSATIGGVAEGIDPNDFLQGEWVEESGLPNFSPESPDRILDLHPRSGDLRGAIMDGLITLFHYRLVEALQEFGGLSVQYFKCGLRDVKTGNMEGGYRLVNILTRVKALDMKRSKFQRYANGRPRDIRIFYINEAATKGQSIFRLDEFPSKIIINEELYKFISKKMDEGSLSGLKMKATEYHRYDHRIDGEIE